MNSSSNRRSMRQQNHVFTEEAALTVAILSDTHAHLDRSVIERIKGADIAIHAGDVSDACVLDELSLHVKHVFAVAGNNDAPDLWPLDQQEIVNALPEMIDLDLPGGRIAIEHGHRFGGKPPHEALRAAHPEARIVVYGHTHKITCDQDGLPWVVNPGAAGLVRNHGGPTCLMLEVNNIAWSLTVHRSDGTSKLKVS